MRNGVELNFNNNSKGINIEVEGTTHTDIDGDMKKRIEKDIRKFLDGKNPVTDAKKSGNIDVKTLKKIKNDE